MVILLIWNILDILSYMAHHKFGVCLCASSSFSRKLFRIWAHREPERPGHLAGFSHNVLLRPGTSRLTDTLRPVGKKKSRNHSSQQIYDLSNIAIPLTFDQFSKKKPLTNFSVPWKDIDPQSHAASVFAECPELIFIWTI